MPMPPPQYNPTDMIPREAGGASGTSNTSSSGEPPAYASISEHTPTSKSSPAQQQQVAAPSVSSSTSLPLKSESSRTMVSARARRESETQKSRIIESSVVVSSNENDEANLATSEIVPDQEASKDSLEVVCVDSVEEISRRDEKN